MSESHIGITYISHFYHQLFPCSPILKKGHKKQAGEWGNVLTWRCSHVHLGLSSKRWANLHISDNYKMSCYYVKLGVLNFTSTLQLTALSDYIKCVWHTTTRILTTLHWLEQITTKKKKGSQLESTQWQLSAS